MAAVLDAKPGHVQVLVLVVGRGALLDQVRQLLARARVVAHFQAARVDDGQRVAGLGVFLSGLGDGFARAGLGQFAPEHRVDQGAFAHPRLARDQDVHAARAARGRADGVGDGVLQGGGVGA
ncbi:hypothetical protein D3C87_1481330 [compost metagenome]